ncbi:MAG: MBL fold metallo-hydrolase [Actinomycetia bacterium]|nr:MBL fold metallo-hydrolase [Actinomycetes bacterium]
MLIASFPAGPLQANCYLVAPAAGAGCVVIDPGQESAEGVAGVVREHDLTPEAVLITHGHFDHMWDTSAVARTYDAPVWIHPSDRHLLADPMAAISNDSARMLREQLGMTEVPEFSEPADVRDAADGTTIDVAGLTFTVDHTPGHTPGTVSYRIDYEGPEDISQLMFTGDFLFAGSIGRTDLNGGDHEAMLESLASKVLPLPDDVVVLPGHGPQTAVGRERTTNPFLAELVEGRA